MTKQTVTIIGGGAFGTALACSARRAGNDVILWARNDDVVRSINEKHINDAYLPNISLDKDIKATTDMAEALANADSALLVTPSQHLRDICKKLNPHMGPIPVAICAKGVERGTDALMSDVVAEELPQVKIGVLSGPTFAKEVAAGLPTAVTLAAHDKLAGEQLVAAVGAPTFRPYLSDDVIGVEIGGAVKNVLAIACGIVTGRKLGDNSRAALITRGLVEMSKLAMALGAKPETVMGLSGLGDLTLTCSSPQSRNMSFGIELGQGKSKQEILDSRAGVTEGVWSASSVTDLARHKNIDMPICEAINEIVTNDAEIDSTIHALLSRPFKTEAS